MKTIIACTDFSDNATNAVQYAAALAHATEARLVLFHHFRYPIPATDFPGMIPDTFVDEIAANFERQLKDLGDQLTRSYPIKMVYVVRSWDFLSDLEDIYASEEANLVVMGMQGRSPVANAMYGSLTASAIRRGKLPLLVVSQGVVFHPIKKILFPFDDQAVLNPITIEALVDLATSFGAYVEIFTMFDLDKTPKLVPKAELSPAKQHLETLLQGIRHGYSYENERTIDEGILGEAARNAADLVAMIPHHHSLWSNLFNQSETQRVATTTTLPLLVMGEVNQWPEDFLQS